MTDRDSNGAAFDPNLGPVHRIESRRSEAQTYAAFYELYGGDTLVDLDGSISEGMMIDGRVLHRNNPSDRSVHLILRQNEGNRMFQSIARMVQGQREYKTRYDPMGFVVVTTDGKDIQRWRAHSAEGLYKGRLDTILNPYMPENETIYVDLIAAGGLGKASLQFNVATAEGVMCLPGGDTGWILGELDSRAERARVLESAAAIGHSAVAS